MDHREVLCLVEYVRRGEERRGMGGAKCTKKTDAVKTKEDADECSKR